MLAAIFDELSIDAKCTLQGTFDLLCCVAPGTKPASRSRDERVQLGPVVDTGKSNSKGHCHGSIVPLPGLGVGPSATL